MCGLSTSLLACFNGFGATADDFDNSESSQPSFPTRTPPPSAFDITLFLDSRSLLRSLSIWRVRNRLPFSP